MIIFTDLISGSLVPRPYRLDAHQAQRISPSCAQPVCFRASQAGHFEVFQFRAWGRSPSGTISAPSLELVVLAKFSSSIDN